MYNLLSFCNSFFPLWVLFPLLSHFGVVSYSNCVLFVQALLSLHGISVFSLLYVDDFLHVSVIIDNC